MGSGLVSLIAYALRTRSKELAIRRVIGANLNNLAMLIVEEEQGGKKKAAYGKYLLKRLAEKLTSDFEKNLDERELRRMRQFFLLFPIRDALRPELSWTHYRSLLKVKKEDARTWYMNEAANEQWGARTPIVPSF